MSRELIYCSILVAVVLVCYHNSLDCGFVFDDASAIRDNKDLRPTTPWGNLFWNDFWGTPMHKERSHKSYRPLCVLSFRLNYAFSELEPWSYHLVNNILHAVVCVLFFRLCQMFMRDVTSFLTALLFAVHPIHTEAVTGVVGRAELLSSIFYLLALMSYSKSTGYKSKTSWVPLCITVVLVTVAMLCKEQGITVIGVCCVYEVFIAQRMTVTQLILILRSWFSKRPQLPSWLSRAMVRTGFLVGVTVCLLLARVKVMGAQLPVFTRFDNPASMAPAPTRHLTLNYLLPVNAWLLLCPAHMCCDWTMGTIPLIESVLDIRNLGTLLFYWSAFTFIKFALTERGNRSRAIIMSLSLMVLPFIPASNLFFPVGFVIAERILYAPSMGFCMLVALGFELLVLHRRRLRHVLWLLMSLLVLTHACKTFVRNYDWETEYAIFKAALRVNQRNAKLYNNVGHALESEKQYDEALVYFQQAAKVQPDDIGAHINVGRTFNTLKQFNTAEEAYRVALALLPPIKSGQSYTTRIAPNHLNVFINLGNLISKDESRLLEADALYRTAISMRSDFIQAYINRGDILMRLNRSAEAEAQYMTALHYDEDNADLYYNLGVVYLEQGKKIDAFKQFETALKYNAHHKQTLFNSAVLRQEIGDPKLRPDAYNRLHQLLKDEADNEKIYFNLGMLSMDDKQFTEARKWFDKAIEIKEDFRSALFNTALMLNNDLNIPLEAVPYLDQLLKHFPNHTKGLILMGDININHIKDLDAAEVNFKTILANDPRHIQANHNLCVVYVERADLITAEKCLARTLDMAPNEKYIQQHLNIVRNRIFKVQQRQQQSQHKHEQQQQEIQQQQHEQHQHEKQQQQQQQQEKHQQEEHQQQKHEKLQQEDKQQQHEKQQQEDKQRQHEKQQQEDKQRQHEKQQQEDKQQQHEKQQQEDKQQQHEKQQQEDKQQQHEKQQHEDKQQQHEKQQQEDKQQQHEKQQHEDKQQQHEKQQQEDKQQQHEKQQQEDKQQQHEKQQQEDKQQQHEKQQQEDKQQQQVKHQTKLKQNN